MKAKSTAHAAHLPGPLASPAPAARGGREAVPPRVVLCERDPAGTTPIYLALQTIGIEPLRCRDLKALLEEAAQHCPDVVICDLAVGSREDIFLLELLRRVAPVVPLILVASEGSLVTQRLVQGLRPMYYMVGPVEGPELQEAVEAALARRARGAR
jgi:DNA-binding response OmpR family regulator